MMPANGSNGSILLKKSASNTHRQNAGQVERRPRHQLQTLSIAATVPPCATMKHDLKLSKAPGRKRLRWNCGIGRLNPGDWPLKR